MNTRSDELLSAGPVPLEQHGGSHSLSHHERAAAHLQQVYVRVVQPPLESCHLGSFCPELSQHGGLAIGIAFSRLRGLRCCRLLCRRRRLHSRSVKSQTVHSSPRGLPPNSEQPV